MKSWSPILVMGVISVFLLFPSSTAFAKTQGYCLECHSNERIQGFALQEYRSIFQAKLDPCPGLRLLSEEIFFTESRIIKLDEILTETNGEGRTTDLLKKEVSKKADLFLNLKDGKIFSAGKFSQNVSNSRASLQKVYDQTLLLREELDRRWLIGVGGLIFLGLIALIGMGYRKLNQMGKTVLLFCFIGPTFFLTSCSMGPAEPKKKSPAMERLEQALFVASHSTTRMEERFYQSILLSEIAGDWAKIESGAAEKAFELAWKMALKAREKAEQIQTLQEVVFQYPDESAVSKKKVYPVRNSSGTLNPALPTGRQTELFLKPNSTAEQRGIISNGVNFDTVLDLRDELENGTSRTWALRAIAEEWYKVNGKKGRKALEYASQQALTIKKIEIRDRELKTFAEDWAAIDPTLALKMGRSITDPLLKSIALTHIGEKIKNENLLEEAWDVAQALPPSFPQTKALIKISTTAARIHPQEKKTWEKRVSEQIKNLKFPALQAFAAQEMVSQWVLLDQKQAEDWVDEILPHFPEGHAYSLIQLSSHSGFSKEKSLAFLKKALLETSKVTDPFEAKKIKSLIVKGVAKLDPEEALRMIPHIKDPFYRSEILQQLARQFSAQDKKRSLDLADKIPFESFRMKTIVAIIARWVDHEKGKIAEIYQKTLPIISSIADPHQRALGFIQLGKDWGRLEKEKESTLFDLALKSVINISSSPIRAEIFESLAEELKSLDKKKAQTVLNDIDPSVHRTRKLLEEIRLWSKIDPRKVLPWAETIPTAFALEKAMAFRDIAITLKQVEPSLAFDLFEKSLTLGLASPEGTKRNKFLSPLVKEMVLHNREKSLQRLLQIDDQQTRDPLLREAGNGLIKEDPLWSLRFIREISESSLRIPLYQKIADEEGKRLSSKRPELLLFHHWGRGRLKAKQDELQAIPHYEKALQEMEKIFDPKDRSYFLTSLAMDWAQVNEEKALKVVETISSDHPESFSFGLLQIGSRLGKWNRREAHPVFERALSSAIQIQNPLLCAKRLLQIAQEWQILDRERGKKILERAEKEARKNPSRNGVEEILYEIFLFKMTLEPTEVFAISQQSGSPFLQARILLEGARRLTKITIDENVKALETALQFAQLSKNPHLLGEIGVSWSSLDMKKCLEIIRQAESREIRLNALRRIAKKTHGKKEAEPFLRQATEEVLGMDDLSEKLKGLKAIANDWASIDKEQAKALYHMAYRLMKERVIF